MKPTALPLVLTASLALHGTAPAQTPRLLADTSSGPAGSILSGVANVGHSATFWSSDTGAPGTWKVWRTDATPAGTWATGANASGFVLPCGDRFVSFESGTPASGMLDQVVAIDGRVAGTTLLASPGPVYAEPGGQLPDRVVFAADDGVHGFEPWVTDGTPVGTHLLADIVPGAAGSFVASFCRVGQVVFFFAFPPPFGRAQLWSTDGTTAGTRLVTANAPYPPQVQQRPMLAAAGDKLFLGIPSTATTPFELFVVDGPSGPVRSVFASQPPSGFDPDRLVPLRGGVLFAFEDAAGVEPWISDGTTQGTHRLIDLEPGAGGSSPELFDTGDPALFFAQTGGTTGLYVTDGTAAGTTRIHTYRLGYWWAPWGPFGVFLDAGSDRLLFFDGNPSQPPADLWETDRTAAGTRLLLPAQTAFGIHLGQLLYVFDDGVHGREPWARGIGPVATRTGIGCGIETRVPTLRATAPRLGSTLGFAGCSAPPSAAALLVLGAVPDAPLRLPGGCMVQVDPALCVPLDLFVLPGSDWTRSIPLPSSPALSGITVAIQAWFLPSGTPTGLEMSNGVHLTLGP